MRRPIQFGNSGWQRPADGEENDDADTTNR